MQMRQTFCFLLFISYKVCANLFGKCWVGSSPRLACFKTILFSLCLDLSDLRTSCALSGKSLLKSTRVREGKEMDRQGRQAYTKSMQSDLLSVSHSIWREPRTAKGGRTEKKGRRMFACIQMSTHLNLPLLSSITPTLTLMKHWLWWVQLPPPALFKSTAPRGTSRRSPGPLLSQTAKAAPPEPRGLNSQTHR